VNDLLIGLVGAMLATNQPLAISNLVQQHVGITVNVVNPNDPAEQELQKLMAEDDAATTEVDRWIREDSDFHNAGAGETKDELRQRIVDRFASVKKDYDDFVRRYPDFARGRLAYGSFLNDTGDEDAAIEQYEIAGKLDPKNPAAWNNMANYYGEHGPLTNAFIDYATAIQLNPLEPVYYQNFATTVYLYRKDVREFYHIDEQQVFDMALGLYKQAMKLDPENFPLATDYAQSYYGIRPMRTNDALVAWTNTLAIARDEVEREGVYIHLARVKTYIGQYDAARAQLEAVTNSNYTDLKNRLEKNINEREKVATNRALTISTNNPAIITNAPAAKN
jgi:tetratricopeptide (TPR) repeat protein